ncbi:hypothetical protein Tco_0859476 [Tanacetum coccineum]|uniref:Reverse transcriptase domain-containing protein n=1 Tax=Tanacetum coccineum TaxID=301880 RepID=A0ABQ5BG10_9ASTR
MYSSYSAWRVEDACKKVRERSLEPPKVILNCSDAEEKVVISLSKDCYPLPEIDWKVESLSGFQLKFFLNAYKEYHHIQMVVENTEKTAFYIGKGVYCYMKMPLGLKNVGATYQRLVNKAFVKQIGRNLEAYVDDMVIKSMTKDDLPLDIQETFDQI